MFLIYDTDSIVLIHKTQVHFDFIIISFKIHSPAALIYFLYTSWLKEK